MEDSDKDRREFLAKCGRFAVITPPVMTALLSTTLTSDAIAHSGGKVARGNNGFGNGGDDGSNAGKQDVSR